MSAMRRSQRWGDVLAWAVTTAAFVTAAAAGFLDLRYGTFSRPVTGTVVLVTAVAATAVLAVGLLSCTPPGRLAWSAAAAAALSLAGSAVLHSRSSARGGQELVASDAYSALEPTALLLVLVCTARRGSPAGASVAAPLLFAAVVVRPLAIEVREGGVIAALVLAVVASTALGAGLTGRLVAADQQRRDERVRLEQRADFARDLHDFVAHHVTGIVVQAQGARAVAARSPELVVPALELIERTGAEALTSMRRMIDTLRADDTRAPMTPVRDLTDVRLLTDTFTLPGARVRFTEHGDGFLPPVEIADALHRVVMEALTNVRKHARGCRRVNVDLTSTTNRVEVHITDDGRSRPTTESSGYGLRGLRERVAAVDGEFGAGPTPDGGWSVTAVFTPVGTGAEGPRPAGSRPATVVGRSGSEAGTEAAAAIRTRTATGSGTDVGTVKETDMETALRPDTDTSTDTDTREGDAL